MKVLVDTNVIAEAMLVRKNSAEAQASLNLMSEHNFYACITSPSFCTLIYLLEHGLKEMQIRNPKRTETMRQTTTTILDCFGIIDMTSDILRQSVNDPNFIDLEDSCQYWAAKNAKCDILLTFNISDFANCDGDVIVMSPSDFLQIYK